MAFTNKTPNYDLPQWVAGDKPQFLTDMNNAYSTIDATMHELALEQTTAETELTQLQTQIQTLSTSVDDANTTASEASTTASGAVQIVNNAVTQVNNLAIKTSEVKKYFNNSHDVGWIDGIVFNELSVKSYVKAKYVPQIDLIIFEGYIRYSSIPSSTKFTKNIIGTTFDIYPIYKLPIKATEIEPIFLEQQYFLTNLSNNVNHNADGCLTTDAENNLYICLPYSQSSPPTELSTAHGLYFSLSSVLLRGNYNDIQLLEWQDT